MRSEHVSRLLFSFGAPFVLWHLGKEFSLHIPAKVSVCSMSRCQFDQSGGRIVPRQFDQSGGRIVPVRRFPARYQSSTNIRFEGPCNVSSGIGVVQ